MNIVITGVSRGVGEALVQHYCNNPKNHVYGITRHTEALQKWAEYNNIKNLTLHKIDISTPTAKEEITKAIQSISEIDLLINNAGKLSHKPFLEVDVEQALSVFQVNYFGAATVIQACLPKLLQAKQRSHVINIGSMGGFQGTQKFAGLNHYSASKAAISCLTECLAEEFKNENVSFNCIALGAVQTEMLNEAFPGYQAPCNATQAAEFIANVAALPHMINGKVIPMSVSTP
ncbi:MAG: SDR family NAD(P)-dependent oxidoreductase [Luteibaculaceae bacterium]